MTLPKSILEKAGKIFDEKKIPESKRQEIIRRLEDAIELYKYDPGEAMGVISAQSISEPATQMTMRSYHVAGSAGIKVTLGLPRLMEIFDARRTPTTPAMAIYLDKAHQSKEAAREIATRIKEIVLKELVEEDILDLLNMQFEIVFDTKKVSAMRLNKDQVIDDLAKSLKDISVKSRENKAIFIPKKGMNIQELRKLKFKILESHVHGVKGISQVVVKKDENEWVLNTLGSNLKKVLAVEGVDASRTITNDIHEVAKTLGIEAARTMIITEASKTLGEQGLDVDIRHIMLVADVMTTTGMIKAIGRYGVAGSKGSVLARAAFEETIKHLTAASIRGRRDKFEGIIENVMIGQVIPIGTGMFDLVMKVKEEEEK